MILSRRTVHSLLAAMTLLNLIFRYPIGVSHELGSDTTFIHSLASSIVLDGHAAWILHPLSYFGLYALSYPSAIPFLLASAGEFSGAPTEMIMIVFGWIISIVGCWGAFLFARALRRDDRFALLVALLFPLAPFFWKDTFWVAATRGFVVGLLLVFLLLLVNSMKRRTLVGVVIALALFVLLAAIHRMGVLALFFLVAYAFAIPFHKLTQHLRFALVRYEKQAHRAIAVMAVGGFFGIFYLQFLYPGALGANVFDQYGTSALLQGETFPILVANMGVSLSGKVGPLFLVAPFGLLAYVWRRPKEATDKFILTAAILFLPLLSLRDYIAEFLIPLFILLGVIGLLTLPFSRRKIVAVALIIVVVGSVAVSWEMKDYWRDRYYTDGPLPNDLYGTSLYIHWQTEGNVVSTEGMSAGRLAAISDRPVLPIGGASNHWYGPQQLTFWFVNGSGVAVRLIPLTSISFQTDEIFIPVGVPNAKDDFESIFYNRLHDPTAQASLDRYHVRYLFMINDRPYEFQSYLWRPS